MSKAVWAAGAVVRREGARGAEVVLVHRPRYDDWSLPKGKAEPGEQLPVTAVRELREETGLDILLRGPLDSVHYRLPDGGRKHVAYWRAGVVTDAGHEPGAEVDEIRWLPYGEALKTLSYETDRAVLRQAGKLSATTPLLVVRHGKAEERKHWRGADVARPLAERGLRQAERLVPLLAAYHPVVAVSSPAVRCRQTLAPFLAATGLPVELPELLTEEAGSADPGALGGLIRELARRTATSDEALVLCCHRPLLPRILAALGLTSRPFGTADVVVAHLDRSGAAAALETHPSPL